MVDAQNITITLDRDDEEPIYRQLISNIRLQIDSGTLTPGMRLPASRDLARRLEISRISVVNAYAELRAEGYLSAHAGRGTFVAKGKTAAEFHATPTYSEATIDQRMEQDRSVREMIRLARKPGVINFSQGTPPKAFIPLAHLREAINQVLDRDGVDALTYEATEGYGPLRAAVRDYVSSWGIQTPSSQVLITGGTQQAVDMVIQAVLAEGDTLVTSNPTYVGAIDIARTRRVHVHGIPMDNDGIRLDCLENYLVDNRPKLLYITPTFQNPTGNVMPLHRRRQLLRLAEDYGLTILEDGVYEEFNFDGEMIPPLKALDEHGIVIYASGFTKVLLPGLRIGYLISDLRHYERLARVKASADISTPGLNQRAIHLMLKRGILSGQSNRNVADLRYRREVALAAAEKYLPPGCRWKKPKGGLYLWVELPRTGPTASELFVSAVQMGVAYAIGNVFHTDGSGSYHMRINFALQQPEQIEEGFRRLGRAWRELACDYDDLERTPLI
ncbi:MAG: PLP-dependent aminotransferase family protein [Chloroflexota bacterium]